MIILSFGDAKPKPLIAGIVVNVASALDVGPALSYSVSARALLALHIPPESGPPEVEERRS
jgi:hypothetical protein